MRAKCRAPFILLVYLCGITPAASADWLTRGGDAGQTGHVSISFDPNQLQSSWSAPLGQQFAISGGKVVTSSNGSLRAFDVSTGQPAWTVTGALFHEVTISNGAVFVATGAHSSSCGVTCSEKTYLRSYNLNDGGFRFRTEFSSQWYSGWGPVPFDGSLYMNGGYYGGLYAFGSNGGATFLSLAQYDGWQPAVDASFVYTYVGGSLQVINRQSLAVTKNISNPNFNWQGWSMGTSPLIGSPGHVLVRHGGRLISFNVAQGNLDWSNAASFSGQPVFSNGTVYAVSAGALAAINSTNGNQLWGWEHPGENLSGSLLLTDSHIFVQAASGTYAIDLTSHQSTWHSNLTGTLAFSDGRLFIGSQTFTLIPEPAGCILLLCAGFGSTLARRRSRSTLQLKI